MTTLASSPWSHLTFSKSIGDMWRDLGMLMWVVVGIHKSDVEAVLKTYHTMSQHSLMLHPLSSVLDAMPQVEDFLLEHIH